MNGAALCRQAGVGPPSRFYGVERAGKQVRLSFDPARLVKKTIDIETR